jgi:hypothetical protein
VDVDDHLVYVIQCHFCCSWRLYRLLADYDLANFIFQLCFHTDLLFHAPRVMEKIRECVDAQWKEDELVYVTK